MAVPSSSVLAVREIAKSLSSPYFLARFPDKEQCDKAIKNWKRSITRLAALGRLSAGNKLTVFRDGDQAFEELWGSLAMAKKKVVVEMYTIASDDVGKKTVDTLTAARKSGSDVVVIYDGLGSMHTKENLFTTLKSLGGATHHFNPMYFPWSWQNFRSLFRRNHRKIVGIDEAVGFIGGMNISNKYAGTKVGGTGYFRDIQVKVEGPAVAHLMDISKDLLSSLKRNDPSVSFSQMTGIPLGFSSPTTGVCIQVLDSNTHTNKREIQQAFKVLLKGAQSNCHITTPYFLPPIWLRSSILNTARRGVKVRIITAGNSDVPIVRFASQHIYSKFLKSGVEIYEMFGHTLHAKTFTVDGLYSSVGSFNFDLWSGSGNLETNIGIFDPETTSVLDEQFEDDKTRCKPVTLQQMNERPYIHRLVHWASYLFMNLMRPPKVQAIIQRLRPYVRRMRTRMRKTKGGFVRRMKRGRTYKLWQSMYRTGN